MSQLEFSIDNGVINNFPLPIYKFAIIKVQNYPRNGIFFHQKCIILLPNNSGYLFVKKRY
jgi:hypothetical protein